MLQSCIELVLHVMIKQLIYLQHPYHTVQMCSFIDFYRPKKVNFRTITFALMEFKSLKHFVNIFLTLDHN